MNYTNRLLLIEEYKHVLNKNNNQAMIIENSLLKEGLLESSMEFIFTFGPLILDAIGGLIALTGVGLPLAGGIATASRGVSIGGCLYFSYKLKEAFDNDSFSEVLFSSLGLIFSAASAGVPGAGSLTAALSRGVVKSLEAAFGTIKGGLNIAKVSLEFAKNSKAYGTIGKAIMDSKVIGMLSRIYSSSLMQSTIKLIEGLGQSLSKVTTIGLKTIASKLRSTLEYVIPILKSFAAKINNFFTTLKYGKLNAIPAEEMGLLTHASLSSSIISVSDDTALIISKHSKALPVPLNTAIASSDDVILKSVDSSMKNDALAVSGLIKNKNDEESDLDDIIWESNIKRKIINSQKIINLIN